MQPLCVPEREKRKGRILWNRFSCGPITQRLCAPATGKDVLDRAARFNRNAHPLGERLLFKTMSPMMRARRIYRFTSPPDHDRDSLFASQVGSLSLICMQIKALAPARTPLFEENSCDTFFAGMRYVFAGL